MRIPKVLKDNDKKMLAETARQSKLQKEIEQVQHYCDKHLSDEFEGLVDYEYTVRNDTTRYFYKMWIRGNPRVVSNIDLGNTMTADIPSRIAEQMVCLRQRELEHEIAAQKFEQENKRIEKLNLVDRIIEAFRREE